MGATTQCIEKPNSPREKAEPRPGPPPAPLPKPSFLKQKIKQFYPLGWGFFEFDRKKCAKILCEENSGIVHTDKKGTLRYSAASLFEPAQAELEIILNVIEIFKELARQDRVQIPALKSQTVHTIIRDQVATILEDYLSRHQIKLKPTRMRNLLKIAVASVAGNLGPLEWLMKVDDFEEITFNGIGRPIFVKHRKYGRLTTNFFFTELNYVKENIINKIAAFVGVPNISEKNPVLPATLPNLDRLHALMCPVVDSIAFTIRHFPKHKLTLDNLVRYGTLTKQAAAYLKKVMVLGKTVFLVGATATGKTTLLNALLEHVPPDSRVLSLEEVCEIHPPHQNFLHHQTCHNLGVTMSRLIESSLRETPDRVVIGEVRTGEDIKAFLELAQAGPGEGSYATFHGETLETAINRLKHHGIAECDLAGAVHLFILMKRRRKIDPLLGVSRDIRHVTEIAELRQDATLNKIFIYDDKKSCLLRTKNRSLLEQAYLHST